MQQQRVVVCPAEVPVWQGAAVGSQDCAES